MNIPFFAIMSLNLQNVVRDVFLHLPKDGHEDNPEVFLAIRLDHPGVVIPESVRSLGSEITLLFQLGYQDLQVLEDKIVCKLTFGIYAEEIQIPFGAIANISSPKDGFSVNLVPTL